MEDFEILEDMGPSKPRVIFAPAYESGTPFAYTPWLGIISRIPMEVGIDRSGRLASLSLWCVSDLTVVQGRHKRAIKQW